MIKVTKTYLEIKVCKTKYRLFPAWVNSKRLKWHVDLESRLVQVLNGRMWKIQFDNDIPRFLYKNKTVYIPKNHYHRLLKGDGHLVIKIKEIN
jgi:hypothetical protein